MATRRRTASSSKGARRASAAPAAPAAPAAKKSGPSKKGARGTLAPPKKTSKVGSGAKRTSPPTPEARVASRARARDVVAMDPGTSPTDHGAQAVHAAAVAAATRWALVTARDLMRENVVTVARETPLSELERIFSDQKISGAPVTDETGQIVGIVTMRDLIDQYSEDDDGKPRHGHDWFSLSSEQPLDPDSESFEIPENSEETVADIMTAEVLSVPENVGMREIAKKMIDHKVHRMLVERSGEPGVYIGIVGTFEILDMLTE